MSSDSVEISHRLRSAIEATGLSFAEAARRAGEKDGERLKQVITGRQRCPVELLSALTVIGVDVNYILTGKPALQPQLRAEQERAGYSVEVLSKEEQALLDNYRHAPPDGRAALETTSAALAQSGGGKRKTG